MCRKYRSSCGTPWVGQSHKRSDVCNLGMGWDQQLKACCCSWWGWACPVGMLMPGCLHPTQTHSSVGWNRQNPSLRGRKALLGTAPKFTFSVSGSSLLLWTLFGRVVHSYVFIVSVLFCYLYSIKKLFKKRKKKEKKERKTWKIGAVWLMGGSAQTEPGNNASEYDYGFY